MASRSKQTKTKRTSKGTRRAAPATRVGAPDRKPYGDPIREAIARGRLPEMKRLLTSSRKWLSEQEEELDAVRDAIAELERAVRQLTR